MGRPISKLKVSRNAKKRKMVKKMMVAPIERKCLKCDRKFLSFNNFRICASCTVANRYAPGVDADYQIMWVDGN
jgi:hypothetical protein